MYLSLINIIIKKSDTFDVVLKAMILWLLSNKMKILRVF